jgi:uncharacterized protein YjaZ
MEFTVLDTASTFRRLLDTPDADQRETIFRTELVAPFAGLTEIFGGGDGLAQFAMWGMAPDYYTPENPALRSRLEVFRKARAWERTAEALERCAQAFAPFADRIPVRPVTVGLMLVDPARMAPGDQGYSGFGAIPGWLLTVFSGDSPEVLKRIESVTAHELHHNIHARIFPFDPMGTTVAQYMIMEGLAESFAAALFGESTLGHFVTGFDESRLEAARAIMRDGLNQTGFGLIRAYIFGDTVAQSMGLPVLGLPDFAGYALGYRVVQAFLERTDKSVVEATFVPAAEIVRESRFFND